MRSRLAIALALALAALPAPATARVLTLGFDDDGSAGTPRADAWLDSARDLGAGVLRVTVNWSDVAPVRPAAGFRAGDPDDPGYRWAATDAAVKAVAARGITPIVTVMHAPRWAEGDDRPGDAATGSWKPDPTAFGAFMTAAATRYSGAHPDPAAPGAVLPRVRLWQLWNEPNLSLYLAPQWRRGDDGWRTVAPAIFRRLLNAGYAAIKAVQPDAVVAAGGTAPYGDPGHGQRLGPVFFMRALVCAPGAPRQIEGCDDPAHFDVFDHHPYGVGSPSRHALNPGDAAVPDLRKITVPVQRAVAAGRVLPRRHKDLWITEISWDSSPPDPDGVPEATHARWLSESLAVLSDAGADLVLWLMVRDQKPVPSYARTYQAGVELEDGTPKPAAQAFRFPFVVQTDRRRVWGRAPGAGVVELQRGRPGHWRTFERFTAAPGQVFRRRVRLGHGVSLRARQGAEVTPETKLP